MTTHTDRKLWNAVAVSLRIAERRYIILNTRVSNDGREIIATAEGPRGGQVEVHVWAQHSGEFLCEVRRGGSGALISALAPVSGPESPGWSLLGDQSRAYVGSTQQRADTAAYRAKTAQLAVERAGRRLERAMAEFAAARDAAAKADRDAYAASVAACSPDDL